MNLMNSYNITLEVVLISEIFLHLYILIILTFKNIKIKRFIKSKLSTFE